MVKPKTFDEVTGRDKMEYYEREREALLASVKLMRKELREASGNSLELRDQFAMAALTGAMSNLDVSGFSKMSGLNHREICACYAKASYNYADAMLKARKESGDA